MHYVRMCHEKDTRLRNSNSSSSMQWKCRLFFSTLFRVFLSSRFAVEVCFSNFRPEFFQNWPEFFENLVTKKGERHFQANFGTIFLRLRYVFAVLGPELYSKKAEFCQNPEFLLGLSFSQNVEKKSLASPPPFPIHLCAGIKLKKALGTMPKCTLFLWCRSNHRWFPSVQFAVTSTTQTHLF